ncbi:endonuclease [Polaribacter dokdonensis]|uniref:Endonuclease I n=1 Tax=Polaribacter dokdonensis DSW-5 TaxID=1300348 RepID=A0A0N0CG64_9FLAO|nr:endonuclease [Polaribacter dokdonensis]KOY52907.1 Endonuclease I [Polaribacter dokdonensis DSW-5]SEE54247.1 Por secretion system C-terminal sorting domain-containing protein [Polaribacter dokdonensis DSW-5]
MRKKLFLPLFLMAASLCIGQAPAGYYSSATGSGYTLKTQLKNIISNGHIDQGYGALYNAYETSDTDSFYENDNTVLDMYSENPSGSDPYNYTHGDRKCGNYNSENDCYNREHIFPQGFFNSQSPMRTDIHHVVPSDGSVNGRRSNYPFGEVNNATHTSLNGSKVGNNNVFGYTGIVFEPLDEFKGDIARMLFYFATRYEDDVTDSSWDDPNDSSNNPLNGTNNQVYEEWYIQLLYKWHLEDPVSQREIVRNNEAYDFQGNRNPFIDHPEYVSEIWSSVLSNETFSATDFKMYPNPNTNGTLYFKTTTALSVRVFNVLGKVVASQEIDVDSNNLDISLLPKGVYLVKVNSGSSSITKKLIKR